MLIELRNVSYIYSKGSVFEATALKNVNLGIDRGEFIAIIGHTGSGKSTLIQHFNGLMKPTEGQVFIDGENLANVKNLSLIRQKIGLVFQYPEHQLFEETIAKDVAFGPRNLGLPEEEINRRVRESMDAVGLPYEEYKDISPFDLSGGQKRRAAIAGVLVMQPKVLVLDEPTAGLDPKGRDDILGEIKRIYDKLGITVILVSHSMDDVAKLVDRIIVMEGGSILMDDIPREIFKHEETLVNIGLGVPQITSLMRRLHREGLFVNPDCITIEEAKVELERYFDEVRNA